MQEFYHNPRCSKSRQALALLEEKGVQPKIRKYLEEVPSKEEFKLLLEKLNVEPSSLLRKGEAIYKEQYKNLKLNEAEWLEVMLQHPKLIERPIFINGNKAVVGRPPENVLDIL